ncbi:MAG: hypothetical protein K2N36_05750 [Ruminiclostridium sp.]|nr:hypothetical protein [Ruminiclostridium sp.]
MMANMVEINTRWTEENLKEYTKFIAFSKGKLSRLVLAGLAVLYLVVVAGCMALFLVMKLTFALVMAILFTLFMIACGVFYAITLKDFVKATLKSGENEEFNSVLISSDHILICKDQQPIGELDWDKIAKIFINEKAGAIYLCTEENAVLILEFRNITKGTEQELREAVKEKNEHQSKTPG